MPIAHLVPGGADFDRLDDLARRARHVGQVEHFRGHSGWTRILMPGCFSRNSCTCSGRNIWWTLQWPFQRITLLRSSCSSVLAAERVGVRIPDRHLVERDAHRRGPCCGPGADRGRTARGCVRANDHSSAAAALRDVQTMPPCRPQNAFRLAAELMYVTGVMSSVSITSPSWSQASSIWSMPAMSAIEQPAARSGRITGTRSPPRSASFSGRLARMSAVSAMKWTPQKTIARQSRLSAAILAELVAVARQVGQGDHLVLLIVVPQNQQPRPQLVAHRLNPRRERVVLQRLVGLELEGGRGCECGDGIDGCSSGGQALPALRFRYAIIRD